MLTKPIQTKHRSSGWSIVALPAIVVLLIAGGWSIFWYSASRRTSAAVQGWIAQEAKAGRNWSCENEKIRGYPFKIEISCTDLLFKGEIDGKPIAGTARGFQATSPLMRNDNLLAKIEPPFTLTRGDGTPDVTLQWEAFYIELEGPPRAYERIAFMAKDLTVALESHTGDVMRGEFKEAIGSLSISPERHDHAYDFALTLNEGQVPALNGFLGTQKPIFAQLDGTISQASLSGAQSLPDLLEMWRSADGKIDLRTARVTSGGVLVEARGRLDLDDSHHLNGKLDTAFAGFDSGFRQLNIDPAAIAAGRALSGLFGKSNQVPGRLSLPVVLSSGFVSIGPVRTAIQIPPLY
ncbi:MAG TPA: DUF2125 domain-containing protein [Methylocella sp.]|nr:DUF2125 domain-containing protein [Methylocella sp.]